MYISNINLFSSLQLVGLLYVSVCCMTFQGYLDELDRNCIHKNDAQVFLIDEQHIVLSVAPSVAVRLELAYFDNVLQENRY